MSKDEILASCPDPGPAEEALIQRFSDGSGKLTLGEGEFPEGEGPEVTIRAALIRALILQDKAPALRLRGARIEGTLDLNGITLH